MHVWGCPFEVRIYNPQEKKMDPRTISGYFVGYAERAKWYIFYYPFHSSGILELRNAKFLENDLINGSDRSQNIISEKDHLNAQPSTSSDRLIVIHNTPQVQTSVVQSIVEVPQVVDNNLIDQAVLELLETLEQPVE